MKRTILLIFACAIVSIGVYILQSSNLVTGGTAGLALSISFLTFIPFSIIFFLINIPFYLLSLLRMGYQFTASTIFAVSILSIFNYGLQYIPTLQISPILGALLGGVTIGIGLVILFVNNSSLGGANILALYLNSKLKWDPGKVNFIFDGCVVLLGMYSIGFIQGMYSIFSIFIISSIISYYKEKISLRNKSHMDMSPKEQVAS
ncbi:YitT family protein [Bacillus timonensis]|nr:YitT family protein [Bacillus timonensis]